MSETVSAKRRITLSEFQAVEPAKCPTSTRAETIDAEPSDDA